jgi:hypothetical protein
MWRSCAGPGTRNCPAILEGFPDLDHDDEVDASGSLEMLNRQMKNWGLYESYRKQAEQLRVKKEGS